MVVPVSVNRIRWECDSIKALQVLKISLVWPEVVEVEMPWQNQDLKVIRNWSESGLVASMHSTINHTQLVPLTVCGNGNHITLQFSVNGWYDKLSGMTVSGAKISEYLTKNPAVKTHPYFEKWMHAALSAEQQDGELEKMRILGLAHAFFCTIEVFAHEKCLKRSGRFLPWLPPTETRLSVVSLLLSRHGMVAEARQVRVEKEQRGGGKRRHMLGGLADQVWVRVGSTCCVALDLRRAAFAWRVLGSASVRGECLRTDGLWLAPVSRGLCCSGIVEYYGRQRAGMIALPAAHSVEVERAALDLWWDISQDIGKGSATTQQLVDEAVKEAVARYAASGRTQLAGMLDRMLSAREPLSVPGLMLRLDEHVGSMEGMACFAVAKGGFGGAEDDWELVRDLFLQLDSDHNGVVSKDEIQSAITRFEGHSDLAAAFRDLLEQSVPADAAHQVSVGEFLAVLHDLPRVRGERVQWSRTLGLEGEVARLLPPGDLFDGLLGVRALDDADVKALSAKVVEGLQLAVPRLVAAGVARLQAEKYPCAHQLNCKFATDKSALVAKFAVLDHFYSGPESLLGTPNPEVNVGIQVEHCVRSNATKEYTTLNYSLLTCPQVEYQFVVMPVRGVTYPHTPKNCKEWAHDMGWLGECGREHVAIRDLMKLPAVMAAKLQQAEVISVRLFSGPMYLWYNAVLRQYPADLYEMLEGNRYETTIFCIISAVTKLSKISLIPPDRKLYRGLGGMVLPPTFWRANEVTGFRGGVELGLMSTTADLSVALQYSGKEQQRGIVFEIAAGRIDIGADISSLSQYADEKEFLFPPLSCLEVADEPRVMGGVIMVPLRVNLCLKSLTLEQLIERRKELHLAMIRNLREELDLKAKEQQRSVKGGKIHLTDICLLAEYDELQYGHALIPAKDFNKDDEYKKLLAEALDAKVKLLQKQQATIALQNAGASDKQISMCAATPWADFDAQPVEVEWNTIIKSPPKELEIPQHAAPCQAAVLWSVLLRFPSQVSKVKIGMTSIEAAQFHSTALSLKVLGLHHDVFWAAVAGLVHSAPLMSLDVRELQFSQPHRVALARAVLQCTSLVNFNGLSVRNNMEADLEELVMRGSGPLEGLQRIGFPFEGTHMRLETLDNLEWAFVTLRIKVYGWKTLHLRGSSLGKEGWRAVMDTLELVTSLTSLNGHVVADLRAGGLMAVNALPIKGRQGLAEALSFYLPRSAASLTQLDLRGKDLGAEGWWVVIGALEQLKSLTSLNGLDVADLCCGSATEVDLSGKLQEEGLAAAVSQWLPRSAATLTQLNLSESNLGLEGGTALSSSLVQLTSLQILNLSENHLGVGGGMALSSSLVLLTLLQTLNLSENHLGAEGGMALSSSLVLLTLLQTLNLSQNNLKATGGTALSSSLVQLTSLQTLNLCDNNIGAGGGTALSSSLVHLTLLQILDLRYNALGPDGASALSPCLARLTRLQKLCIGDNNIGSQGAAAVAPALALLADLQELRIWTNALGPEGAAALSHSIAKLTKLQKLEFGWNDQLGDQGAMHLAAVLPSMPALTYLDIYHGNGSGIGAVGKAAVKAAALPSLTTIK